VILAIETSCDDTCAAVVTEGGEIRSNVIASQGLLHARYGGVVPEIASSHHLELIDAVTADALERGGVGLDVVEAGAGALERVGGDRVHELEVVARGDLRHHPAVARVEETLRGDHVRTDLAVLGHHGGAGVVAARLDAEDHAVARSGTVRHMMSASSRLSW
jgi:hypothetical protein